MRSHVVRLGHRQASAGTPAQAAPATIRDRAPLTVREQYLARKQERADFHVKHVTRLSREHWATTERPQGERLTVAEVNVRERERGYCWVSERFLVALDRVTVEYRSA